MLRPHSDRQSDVHQENNLAIYPLIVVLLSIPRYFHKTETTSNNDELLSYQTKESVPHAPTSCYELEWLNGMDFQEQGTPTPRTVASMWTDSERFRTKKKIEHKKE
jgi:hypothetical protein